MTEEYFYQKASFLARLGSGSACRSVKGQVVVWGNHNNIKCSSDLFGVEFPNVIHDNFKNFQDTILLVDKGRNIMILKKTGPRMERCIDGHTPIFFNE